MSRSHGTLGWLNIWFPPTPHMSVRFPALACLSIVLVACCVAAAALIRAVVADAETLYPEGWLLQSVLAVRDGQDLYRDYRSYPFIIALYPPVYYYVVGISARLAQLDLASTLTLARMISAAAAAAACGFIMLLARRSGVSRVGALIAGGLLFAAYAMQPWSYTARPDALALGLSLAGLWIGLSTFSLRWAAAAGLLCALAFLTKQTHVAAVGALVLVALLRRQWKLAAVCSVTWIACVSSLVLALQLSTRGLFLANVIAANGVPYQPELIASYTFYFSKYSALLIGLAFLGWFQTSSHSRIDQGVKWYLAISSLIALAALGKVGAGNNQILEATAAAAVLAGRGYDRLAVFIGRSSIWTIKLGVPRTWMALAATAYIAAAGVLQINHLAKQAFSSSWAIQTSDDLVSRVKSVPGDVLTQQDPLSVLRAGKTPVLADPYGLAVLALSGRWDPAPVQEMIEQQAFSLIVLEAPAEEEVTLSGFAWWPPGVRERILAYYQFGGRIGTHYLYAPKPQ
jgi:hypothetical protein